MKKVRITMYKYKSFYKIIIITILFIIIAFSKDKEIFKGLKASIIDIQSFITPKIEVDYKNINEGINKELLSEINELKTKLELKETSDYEIINASVISRNVNTYFSTITIDKGKDDGINDYYAVITEDGLIGYISKIFNNHSTIALLNSSNVKNISVSVSQDGNTYNGNITGYDNKNNEVIVTSIRTNSKISKGSVVRTNGLGKTIPSGINVGVVSKVKVDNNTASKILKVKLYSNIDNIKYVSIIRNKE